MEQAELIKSSGKLNRLTTWLSKSKSVEENDDDLDEFFDCNDEEDFGDPDDEDIMAFDEEADDSKMTKSVMRDRISLSVIFEVKVIQLTLGKINTNNKVEGI